MIQIARAFGEAALSLRPLTDFVLSQLHSQTFALLSNRESVVKQVTGAPYAEAVATARLDCEQRVAAARLQRKAWAGAPAVDAARLHAWLSARAAYQEDELASKRFFLRRCRYFVLDEHMDETGVRRKLRRIPAPPRGYECARDWREASSSVGNSAESGVESGAIGNGTTVSSAVSSPISSSPISSSSSGEARGEWACLEVSVFDTQWGVASFAEDALRFCVAAKPAGLDEVPVIPEMTPLCPMRAVQLYPLRGLEALYKRTYRCQQSALEFFFRDGGFRSSVFLYFPEEVSLGSGGEAQASRNEVYARLAKALAGRGARVQQLGETAFEMMQREGLATAWARGELSNFAYLMELNRIAGRSVQDITQYPVFPWVFNTYATMDFDVA